MINFRFHLVSLIAVFLALGLGILVGSSVVDRAIVDNLEHEINNVKNDSKQANADLKVRDDSLSKLDDYVKKSAAYAVDQRLIDVPVAVVAERGVDADITKATLTMLQAAGADVPGVLWLTDKWRLDNPDDLAKLQSAAHVSGNNAAARAAALQLLARRLAQPPSTGRRKTPDVLEPLRQAGFLDFTDGDRSALAVSQARRTRAGRHGHQQRPRRDRHGRALRARPDRGQRTIGRRRGVRQSRRHVAGTGTRRVGCTDTR